MKKKQKKAQDYAAKYDRLTRIFAIKLLGIRGNHHRLVLSFFNHFSLKIFIASTRLWCFPVCTVCARAFSDLLRVPLPQLNTTTLNDQDISIGIQV